MSTESRSEAYAAAGVDVTAGYESVERIKRHVKSTVIPGVLGGLGGFGGMFKPDLSGIENPVLVSGADGVGTKLKLAFELDRHDTIGIDAVAMCVNDIICAGAKPLFFLDYIAQSKIVPERVERIVAGIADGCRQAGCALVGGETAEMPGFYDDGEYDIAGFAVGIVDEKKILKSENVQVGDTVVGIWSSGVHSNGFSLVRKVFDGALDQHSDELGTTIGEMLLTPTKIFTSILQVNGFENVRSLCNITGGGWYENIPRMLPEGVGVEIDKSRVPRQPIFDLIMRRGGVTERDMYNTFNMGLGMAAVLPPAPAHAQAFADALTAAGLDAGVIGRCTATAGVTIL